MLTLRDPGTGRLYQRPYLVTNPQPTTIPTQTQQVATLRLQPTATTAQREASAEIVKVPADEIVQVPADTPNSVAQTTFESPVLEPTEPAGDEEFSILDRAPELTPVASSDAIDLESATTEPVMADATPSLDETLEIEASTESAPAEPTPQLDLDLDLGDDSIRVEPTARTKALPFDSAGELDLDIDLAPLGSQN